MGILAVVGLVGLAALALLFMLLLRERAGRLAAQAALAAMRDDAADRAARLDLLDRRRAAIAPIDSLWRSFAGGGAPGETQLADAARALAEARLLFAEALQAEIDACALLIVEHICCQAWQAAAMEAGRYDERADLFAEEIARERKLRPGIEALRNRLADAARMS